MGGLIGPRWVPGHGEVPGQREVPGLGGAWFWGVPGSGGAWSRGVAWSQGGSRPTTKGKIKGIWSRPTPKGEVEGKLARPPTPMTTAEGGMHPVGIHYCGIFIFTA